MNSVAIVGLGWLGFSLAKHLKRVGWAVKGTKRTHDGEERMRLNGFEAYLLELTPEINADPDDLTALFDVDSLIINIPPSEYFFDLNSYVQGIKNLVNEALNNGVEHILFISSSAVYPLAEGIFTENDRPNPSSEVGIALFEIENWLLAQHDIDCDILRLSGLIGADRHPINTLAGRKNLPNGNQPVNLVHLTDCILAIELLLETRAYKRVYNLCAPNHPTRADYYVEMAKQSGLDVPEFAYSSHDPQRIICGEKICRELEFDYRYPDPYQMVLEEQTQYFHQD
ncbi:SDR family oxidoreductase [Spirabiliibacterium falconis]|uniref:SDR family oxidoreductase n=1 Tax=Spirabiliibacterium falconis TaxID=572023 RepID=UPI001AAD5388|nr:SDR family oxidoreductase [Spirabiliibacterium falconis]MBE2894310.1 SDR family oxidoreductase [Spirabiliibacterium falconis]